MLSRPLSLLLVAASLALVVGCTQSAIGERTGVNVPGDGQPPTGEGQPPPPPMEAPPPPPADAVLLSQNASLAVAPNLTPYCNAGAEEGFLHADNQFLRVFAAGEFLTGPATLTRVQVGIQEAAAGAGQGGEQPVTVSLYTLAGELARENLTLLGRVDVTVPDQALTVLDVPFEILIAGNETVVAEVSVPDGRELGNRLVVGSNSDGQTAPVFLSTTACETVQPVTLESLAFPDAHVVLAVTAQPE